MSDIDMELVYQAPRSGLMLITVPPEILDTLIAESDEYDDDDNETIPEIVFVVDTYRGACNKTDFDVAVDDVYAVLNDVINDLAELYPEIVFTTSF